MLEELAHNVIALASEKKIWISAAESLTGGLVAATLVDVPGASAVFSGGVVAYNLQVKRSLLGVDPAILDEWGAVHPEVARQMARGVRGACAVANDEGAVVNADIGLSTTGVAGPDPDPLTRQPAGTVWIGLSSSKGEVAKALELRGSRSEIRKQTVEAVLSLLKNELESA